MNPELLDHSPAPFSSPDDTIEDANGNHLATIFSDNPGDLALFLAAPDLQTSLDKVLHIALEAVQLSPIDIDDEVEINVKATGEQTTTTIRAIFEEAINAMKKARTAP